AGVGLPRRHPLLRRDRCRPAHRLGAEERHPGATFPEGVRVVARNEVRDLPWREVTYTITPGKGTATHSITAPGLKGLALEGLTDHETLQQVAQRRDVEAKVGPAIEAFNRGESVGFGAFEVSRAGIGQGRKTLPWPSYGGIVPAQGQRSITQMPTGRFGLVSRGTVRDAVLLAALIDTSSGQLPRTAPAGGRGPAGSALPPPAPVCPASRPPGP